MTSYLDSERHLYTPPNCPGCGKKVRQEWIDATSNIGFAREGERRYMPGLWECSTVGCQYGPPAVVTL